MVRYRLQKAWVKQCLKLQHVLPTNLCVPKFLSYIHVWKISQKSLTMFAFLPYVLNIRVMAESWWIVVKWINKWTNSSYYQWEELGPLVDNFANKTKSMLFFFFFGSCVHLEKWLVLVMPKLCPGPGITTENPPCLDWCTQLTIVTWESRNWLRAWIGGMVCAGAW